MSTATVQTLHDAFQSAGENIWAVVPEYSGEHGHPYIVGREMIGAFLQAPSSSSARDIEHLHQERIEYVAIDDPFVALNINTPGEYGNLTARSD